MKTRQISLTLPALLYFITLFVISIILFSLSSCNSADGNNRKSRKEMREQKKQSKQGKADRKNQKPLKLTITNLESPSAMVKVAFYNNDKDFLEVDKVYKRYKFYPKGNSLTATIDDLEYGEYAISTYQDVDNDQEIDKNKIGIPQEPFAFSNNIKPGMSKPKYDECKFTYNESSNSQQIEMLRKKEKEKEKDR